MLERLLHKSLDVEMEFLKLDCIFVVAVLRTLNESLNENIAEERFKTPSVSSAGLSTRLST